MPSAGIRYATWTSPYPGIRGSFSGSDVPEGSFANMDLSFWGLDINDTVLLRYTVVPGSAAPEDFANIGPTDLELTKTRPGTLSHTLSIETLVDNLPEARESFSVTVELIGYRDADAGGTLIPLGFAGRYGGTEREMAFRLLDTSLPATSGADTVAGSADASVYYLGAGTDTYYGGPAGVRIYGEDGTDRLYAHGGASTLGGGTGDDALYVHSSDNRLFGAAGRDQMYGWAGYEGNLLDGGNGEDTIRSFGSDTTLRGGGGNDLIEISSGVGVYAHGGGGRDRLHVAEGEATLRGGANPDTFVIRDTTGDVSVVIEDYVDGFDILSVDPGFNARLETVGDDLVLSWQDFGAIGLHHVEIILLGAGGLDSIA